MRDFPLICLLQLINHAAMAKDKRASTFFDRDINGFEPVSSLAKKSENFVPAGSHILSLAIDSVDKFLADQVGMDPGNFKNLGLTVGPAMKNIEDYGCWCYFEDAHGTGKGVPVDAVDGHCKTLALGYDCAIIDYNDQVAKKQEAHEAEFQEHSKPPPECIPWQVDHYSAVGFGGMDDIVHDCQKNNPDNICGQFACMVEGTFIIGMIQTFLAMGHVNPEFQLANGFDFSGTCVREILETTSSPLGENSSNFGSGPAAVSTGQDGDGDTGWTGSGEIECCGLLPYRYPYKQKERLCCGKNTYDPTMMECCPDEQAKFAC